jgi:hypothetical protein
MSETHGPKCGGSRCSGGGLECEGSLVAILTEHEEAAHRLDVERKAWARLVKATDAAATRLMSPLPSPEEVEAEHEAAKQALRDLGLDVDALLGES